MGAGDCDPDIVGPKGDVGDNGDRESIVEDLVSYPSPLPICQTLSDFVHYFGMFIGLKGSTSLSFHNMQNLAH